MLETPNHPTKEQPAHSDAHTTPGIGNHASEFVLTKFEYQLTFII
jgi:hypothetical protein